MAASTWATSHDCRARLEDLRSLITRPIGSEVIDLDGDDAGSANLSKEPGR